MPMEERLLMDLLRAYGVSGSELGVRAIIEREIRPFVDEVKVDRVGNLVATIKGEEPRVMLAAHMDEVGLMVKQVEKSGRIPFSLIGGVEPLSLLGQRVRVHAKKGHVNGVISMPELSDGAEIKRVPEVKDLFVDTGLTKEQLDAAGVQTGNYIELFHEPTSLGNPEIIAAKAQDDRIGCFILVEVAKLCQQAKNKREVNFVFTVQEETGLYGARVSAFTIAPDWAIAVDVTNTDDSKEEPTKVLGGGPCVTVKDAEMIGNRCINGWLMDVARRKKIPVQLDVSDMGVTEALSISFARGGVPATVLGVPVRNMHTTAALAHKRDIAQAIELLAELLLNPPLVCIV